jgi:hypothetical protein
VLGDTRTEGLKPSDITYQLVERAGQAQPEIVLAVGDLINALDDQASVREQWRFWREAVIPLGAQRQERTGPWLLVTPGNHDVQRHRWAADLMAQTSAPLQWCLFSEPVAAWRGRPVRLEAVLVNHDVLGPGRYPVRLQVAPAGGGPAVMDKLVTVTLRRPPRGNEAPFATVAFDERVRLNAPAGRYRFVANLQKGGAASGETALHLFDPADMPAVPGEVACVGASDSALACLRRSGIRAGRLDLAQVHSAPQVILCMGPVPGEQAAATLAALAAHVSRGATAIVLAPDFFTGLSAQKNLGNLAGLDPRPGERLLFRTRNSPRCWEVAPRFVEDFVHLSTEGARWLAERKPALVGIDYLSVGGFHQGAEAHQALLGAGVWIIEGLDLTAVEPGDYDLVCLPLRLEGADGAPARALLRRREATPVPGSGRV